MALKRGLLKKYGFLFFSLINNDYFCMRITAFEMRVLVVSN